LSTGNNPPIIKILVTRYADGTQGWDSEGPFDAIIVTAGGRIVPAPLIEQLSVGGKLVIPVGGNNVQELLKLEKTSDGIKTTKLGACRFVKLIGQHGWDR